AAAPRQGGTFTPPGGAATAQHAPSTGADPGLLSSLAGGLSGGNLKQAGAAGSAGPTRAAAGAAVGGGSALALTGDSRTGRGGPPSGPLASLSSGFLSVYDANKGLTLPSGVPINDFAEWDVDLRAQVAGATVASYDWDLSAASDATSV